MQITHWMFCLQLAFDVANLSSRLKRNFTSLHHWFGHDFSVETTERTLLKLLKCQRLIRDYSTNSTIYRVRQRQYCLLRLWESSELLRIRSRAND